MTRHTLWAAIAEAIRADIGAGRYGPGDRLPTEAVLSTRFAVNRHTVRRALAALVEDGLVTTRRGAGAFVAARPTDYAIGRRVRFHRNILDAGRSPMRRIISLETVAAGEEEAAALDLTVGMRMHRCEGISFADGLPIALFRSAFPADRFPGLIESLGARPSVTAALAEAGVADYTRASTRVSARLAGAYEARHLGLKPGAPLLLSVAINVDPVGRPVEFGQTWFVGDRVTLTLNPE